jgi:hypothetical protein
MYDSMRENNGGNTMPTVQSMTKALTLPRNVRISGPYYQFSKPYGDRVTLQRDEWFVTKKLTKKQQKTEIQKITGETVLGCIVKFRNHPKQLPYVISQLYPHTAFKTLQQAVDFLIENHNKLVFCS